MSEPNLRKSASRLWACHECEMIGNQQDAHGHQQSRGHAVEELSQEISDSVRAEWRQEQYRRAAQLGRRFALCDKCGRRSFNPDVRDGTQCTNPACSGGVFVRYVAEADCPIRATQ